MLHAVRHACLVEALTIAVGASSCSARAFAAEIVTRERVSLEVKTRVQLRYQLTAVAGRDVPAPEGHATLGTLRLYLAGHVHAPELRYVVQLALADRDYRDGATSPLYDAFVEWRPERNLSLRVGQFFVPFDRLRTVREFALQFAERPRPVGELTLDRDVGLALSHAHLFGDASPLTVRMGAFGGQGANQSAPREPGGLVVARAELRPLGDLDDDEEGDLSRREEPAFALGVGVAKNWNSPRARSTTGTTYLGGTTDQSHAAIDLVAKWRGVYLAGEALWKRSDTDAIVSTNADGSARREPTRSARGWVAQASYVFERPFEIAARVSRLTPYAGTDPALVSELAARGQEVGLGVNAYVSGHAFKVQASWIARSKPGVSLESAEHTGYLVLDATL